jgi:hypothetical protein
MATCAAHGEESMRRVGTPSPEIHRWLDAFAGRQECGDRHRNQRHHDAGMCRTIERVGDAAGPVARPQCCAVSLSPAPGGAGNGPLRGNARASRQPSGVPSVKRAWWASMRSTNGSGGMRWQTSMGWHGAHPRVTTIVTPAYPGDVSLPRSVMGHPQL